MQRATFQIVKSTVVIQQLKGEPVIVLVVDVALLVRNLTLVGCLVTHRNLIDH